jgi:hypothetical protein
MTGTLDLVFPEHAVTIAGLPAVAETALIAVWGACVAPAGTSSASTIVVERTAGGYDVASENGVRDHTTDEERVAPMVEAFLYASFLRWHPNDTILHAATIVREGRPIVLLGRSGAGKSSVALEAAGAGWGYVTDELTLVDGPKLRGIPRTIQFHLSTVAASLPARLANLDTESYRVLDESGAWCSQPLFSWQELRVVRGVLPASRALVFALAGQADATETSPISPAEVLAEMIRERRGEWGDLGHLVGEGRAYRLSWREPREALEAIARAADRAP